MSKKNKFNAGDKVCWFEVTPSRGIERFDGKVEKVMTDSVTKLHTYFVDDYVYCFSENGLEKVEDE